MEFNEKFNDSCRFLREENFCVKCEDARSPLFDKEVSLLITQNGYQWNGFSLSKNESIKLIEVLSNYWELTKEQ